MKNINKFAYRLHHGIKPKGIDTWRFAPGDASGHIYSDILLTVENTDYHRAAELAKGYFAGYRDVYVLP